jgi:hypothetical protein
LLRAKSGEEECWRCLRQPLDEDGTSVLPDLEPHAVALAKHLRCAADIRERDAEITPDVAQFEFVEAIFVALVGMVHRGPCAFLVQEGVPRIYEVRLIYTSVAASDDQIVHVSEAQ